MNRKSRRIFVNKLDYPGIADEYRVDARFLELFEIPGKIGNIAFFRIDIYRNVNLYSSFVTESNGLFHLFGVEIPRKSAQPEALSRKINGVRSETDSRFKFFKIAGRRKYFNRHSSSP